MLISSVSFVVKWQGMRQEQKKIETIEFTEKMHRDTQSGSILGLCNLSALSEKSLWPLWFNSMRNCQVFIVLLVLHLYKANRTINYFWD